MRPRRLRPPLSALIRAESGGTDGTDFLARRLEIQALHTVTLWLRSREDEWRDDTLFVLPGAADHAASASTSISAAIDATSAGELLTAVSAG